MAFSIETEKKVLLKDRKVAGITAFTAFALLVTLLCFIGYKISNPQLSKPAVNEEVTYLPLDAQLLEQVHQGSQAAGTPARTNKAKTSPLQTEQVLTAQNNSAHITAGNSNMTSTPISNNNPSGAKHVSDNPFGTGGIHDGKFRGRNLWGARDDQNEDPKPTENTARFLITAPNTNDIKSDENAKIVLSVIVDPDGNIVGKPVFVKNGSTTNDVALIEQVIKAVKEQAKFNKTNTTKNTKTAVVIRIVAN